MDQLPSALILFYMRKADTNRITFILSWFCTIVI
nr:MAG TPA: hypothetical protein [Caudoviricetes sp.]DAO08671.1 MAG TPA: hypothetical protein [Caudoviricetes sp.]